MQRIVVPERPEYKTRNASLGFHWQDADGAYWQENAFYTFKASEVDLIERVTNELTDMMFQAVEYVIKRPEIMLKLGIAARFHNIIRRSWDDDDVTLYGRYDFGYSPTGGLKMLEFNADTPTSLVEAAVVQWYALQDRFPEKDQFNIIFDTLKSQFEYFRSEKNIKYMHFACAQDSEEDFGTVQFLRDVASQVGINGEVLYMHEIGSNPSSKYFLDKNFQEIKHIFKLYPWEWMLGEGFSDQVLTTRTEFIEPIWKSILSNKGIMAVLWQLYEGHSNLLPTYFEGEQPTHMLDNPYVRKPMLSREGANVQIFGYGNQQVEINGGDYGYEGHVIQEYFELPIFADVDGTMRYPIVGSWVVGDAACGVGIREGMGLITNNNSRFVPHYFE